MSFFTNIGEVLKHAGESAESSYHKFVNKPQAKALMATCALIAAASDGISKEEEQATLDLINNSKMLKDFNRKELVGYFQEYIASLNKSATFGKIECLEDIGKMKGKAGADIMLMHVGLVIGDAKPDKSGITADETKMMFAVAGALGLDAKAFGLVMPEVVAK